MIQTYEAIIDEKGKVHLLESVNLKSIHRVLITILPGENHLAQGNKVDVTKLGKILDDDLESASQEISESFLKAIEKSARELERN